MQKFGLRKQQSKGIPWKNQKIIRLSFKTGWYPPEWLVWYCYGPPVALNAHQFGTRQMDHLVRENAQATLKESDHLDQAIQAKSAQIKLLVEMGMDALKINEAREELLKLLQTKYEISLNAFDTAM
jgi:hypothetical protein